MKKCKQSHSEQLKGDNVIIGAHISGAFIAIRDAESMKTKIINAWKLN